MAGKTAPESPRIFISHAWEDKSAVRRLEAELRTAGAEVWVDHSGIRGGDNLPKRISDALEWCNILLLAWSAAARNSHWVELEWTNAISLKKTIIPCILKKEELPGILTNNVFIDFSEIDHGIVQLLNTLGFIRKPLTSEPVQPTKQVGQIIHNQLRESQASTKKAKPSVCLLRSQRLESLLSDSVEAMLRGKHFFPYGKGLRHDYEEAERQGKRLVIDHTTGLLWQQSGDGGTYIAAEQHIHELNYQIFADYNDWRLPTLEEAMSLMEPERMNGDLFIDPIFDNRQRWIWTADKKGQELAWVVFFSLGHCNEYPVGERSFVRAVRSKESSI